MDMGPNATKVFVTDSTNADYKSNPRLFRSEFDDICLSRCLLIQSRSNTTQAATRRGKLNWSHTFDDP